MSHPTSAYEPYTFFFSEKIPGTQIHLVAQLQKYNFTITVCCREFSSSLSVDTVLVWAVFQSSVSSDEVNAAAECVQGQRVESHLLCEDSAVFAYYFQ